MEIQQVGVWMMHAVTYRVQLLKQMNYHQSEGISYTDTEWTYLPLSNVESFAYVNRVVYQYLLGRDGQTMNISVMVRSIWQLEQIVKKLADHLNDLSPEMRNSFSYITTSRQIECLTGIIYKICLINQSNDQFDNKICLKITPKKKMYFGKSLRNDPKLNSHYFTESSTNFYKNKIYSKNKALINNNDNKIMTCKTHISTISNNKIKNDKTNKSTKLIDPKKNNLKNKTKTGDESKNSSLSKFASLSHQFDEFIFNDLIDAYYF